MVDKTSSSSLYEAFLEKTSNLKSRTLDTYEDVKDNADEYKERAINGLKKTAVGLATVGMLAGATPALAEDNDKEVTVPIGQVMQSKEDCQLAADQWAQEEVTVSPEYVSEDYLKEIGYGESEDKSKQTSFSDKELVETSEYEGDLEDFQVDEFYIDDFDGDPEVEGVFAYNQTSFKFGISGDQDDVEEERSSLIALYPFRDEEKQIYRNLIKIPEILWK
ncbi:hypothetical protein KGY79_13715 [Candidatus Bipolaricaulota bacterium]|nr:hypothetical protein [Candidatus Bipolaricaulota bacterium]